MNTESEAYRRMIGRSLLYHGNNRRLKHAIAKAKRGEAVTLAFIGGSITQGAGAAPIATECYAYRSYKRFQDMFGQEGGEPVRLIKAGVGGTPSELGMIRYDRDVLRDGTVQPDVVVIEFAVNDADDETEGVCYESLVLKALTSAGSPAVILLFSVFENDWNLQERLAPVGWHYGLPMVSIKDAVTEQFKLTKATGNILSKQEFFSDIYHPANDGHRIMADCLGWLFEQTDQSEPDADDINLNQPPVIGSSFQSVRLLDRASLPDSAAISAGGFDAADSDLQSAEMDDHETGTVLFPHNWMHTPASGSKEFTLTIHSQCLLLIYKNSGSDDFGNAEVWVDGRLVRTAESHAVQWTRCHAVILYEEPEPGDHTVEIRMSAGHEHKFFTILGFGFVE